MLTKRDPSIGLYRVGKHTNQTPRAAKRLFKATRRDFQDLGLHKKLLFPNRKAVKSGTGIYYPSEESAPNPPAKNGKDCQLIFSALMRNEHLRMLGKLDDVSCVEALVAKARRQEVAAGTEIIRQGDLKADSFYIVGSGGFEVLVRDVLDHGPAATLLTSPRHGPGKKRDPPPKPRAESRATRPELASAASRATLLNVVQKCGVGDSFGELALFYAAPRAATVRATQDSVVWVIGRGDFKRILMKVSEARLQEYIRYVDSVDILVPLLKEERRSVASALEEMHFSQSEVILKQGEAGDSFYILYEGSVSIVEDGEVISELSASVALGTTQYFGEGALLGNEVRCATVVVSSDTAKALLLDRDSFELLLGPLKDIMAMKGKARTNMADKPTLGAQPPRPASRVPILLRDLKRVCVLGCGGFGTVELCQHKATRATFALKTISKGHIVLKDMHQCVTNEKDIMLMTNSPFIVRLHETYVGSQYLYFLMELALGGNLYITYGRKSLYGSPLHARYYVASVVFAFEHLHERRIIYRDLKPENLVLTEKGHLKLADMGLAKFSVGKSYTTCGTPEYFAPEMIASTGHTQAVDWWTLGVVIFELMSGVTPFDAEGPMEIYARVMRGIGQIRTPLSCQGPAWALIQALLRKDPSERLPMRAGGVRNIMQHKWFEGFDWGGLRGLSLAPPYVPAVASPTDMKNFERVRKENLPSHVPYVEGTGSGGAWFREFATVTEDCAMMDPSW